MTQRPAAGTAPIALARPPAEEAASHATAATRNRRWPLGTKASAGAALPAVIMALTIVVYGLNVPFWDDWRLTPLLRAARTGSLGLADLWAQDSQHRLLFPRLVSVVLAGITQWDV